MVLYIVIFYIIIVTEPYNFEEVYTHKQKEMSNINDDDILKMRVDSSKNTCEIIQRLKKDNDQMSQITTGKKYS